MVTQRFALQAVRDLQWIGREQQRLLVATGSEMSVVASAWHVLVSSGVFHAFCGF